MTKIEKQILIEEYLDTKKTYEFYNKLYFKQKNETNKFTRRIALERYETLKFLIKRFSNDLFIEIENNYFLNNKKK